MKRLFFLGILLTMSFFIPGVVSAQTAPANANDDACNGKDEYDTCTTFDGKTGGCYDYQNANGSRVLTCLEHGGSPDTPVSNGGTGGGNVQDQEDADQGEAIRNFGSGASSGSAANSSGNPSADLSCNGSICFPQGTGLSSMPIAMLLMRLMNWLLGIFGILAIIAFVISGIQYLISAGDEGMMEVGKRNMKYSIFGVIIALSGLVVVRAIDMALRGSAYF